MIDNAQPATQTWHWIVAAIAVAAAALALGRVVYARRFLHSAATASGTVVDLTHTFVGGNRPEGGGLVWYPTVEYTTASGQSVRYTEKTGTGPQKPAEIGDTVEVRYDPANPQRAMMAAKTAHDVKGLIFFSIVALLIAIVSAATA